MFRLLRSRNSYLPTLFRAQQLHANSLPRRYFSDDAALRKYAIGIIAHVDHGKTTLVDKLLRESVTSLGKDEGDIERIMDSGDIEKERGITILSKVTGVMARDSKGSPDYMLNIVDTPGHADFGGEVERVISMVDCVALVVDATDGPMTQTRFVLKKALERGLRPFVVINKVDKPTAADRLDAVEGEIFDLFDALGATDEQLDFPFLYASAVEGWCVDDMKKPHENMQAFFDMIPEHVPVNDDKTEDNFACLISQIDSHPFFGTTLTGRIAGGKVKSGDQLLALDPQGEVIEEIQLKKLVCRRGMALEVIEEAEAGDIVSFPGFSKATVTATLTHKAAPTGPIQSIPIDPPTLSMMFSVNTSPLAGREGTQHTAQAISDRLFHEKKSNVALQVEVAEGGESFEVSGRGELHLGILIETMRREGFELSVSSPQVVFQKDPDTGNVLEPIEEVDIDVEQEHAATVIEKISLRKGEMQDYENTSDGRARLKFLVPTRGLLGYRSEFLLDTRGQGVINQIFHGYEPKKGNIVKNLKGPLVSMDSGKATSHALEKLQARGTLFIKPGMDVYPGMVVGENSKADMMTCNPTKSKALNNIRTVLKDESTRLQPARLMSLEDTMAYVRDDEMIEVTPSSVRIRKMETLSARQQATASKKKK